MFYDNSSMLWLGADLTYGTGILNVLLLRCLVIDACQVWPYGISIFLVRCV